MKGLQPRQRAVLYACAAVLALGAAPPSSAQLTEPGFSAGRYYLSLDALIGVGVVRRDGSWTGKYGVNSFAEYVNSQDVQERVIGDVIANFRSFFERVGTTRRIGQRIDGLKSQFEVTESGLIAAALRVGGPTVAMYVEHVETHGWTSRPESFPLSLKSPFLTIESRLREFETIPMR